MIIGVTGLSGTGKSTMADNLGKIFDNAKVIHIDKTHINLLLQKPDLLISLYGNDIFKNGEFDGELFMKYPKKLEKAFELSYKDLVEILYNEIKEAKKSCKWIILDFFALPKINEIWQSCDYTILVKAVDNLKRIDMISLRHIKDRKNPNVDIELRDAFAPNFDLYKYDFCISNNYDSNFIQDINNIANQLLAK